MDYLDRVAKLGSGPNGFVSSVDELEDQILKTRFGKSREAAIAEREQLISLGKKGEAQLATLNEQIAKANNEAMAELSNPNKWKKYVNSTNVPTPLDGKYLKTYTNHKFSQHHFINLYKQLNKIIYIFESIFSFYIKH